MVKTIKDILPKDKSKLVGIIFDDPSNAGMGSIITKVYREYVIFGKLMINTACHMCGHNVGKRYVSDVLDWNVVENPAEYFKTQPSPELLGGYSNII